MFIPKARRAQLIVFWISIQILGTGWGVLVLDTGFHNLEFKIEFLAAKDRREIELPKFSREAKRRPALIEIHQQLEAERAPEIGQTHVSGDWLEFCGRVERKRRP